MTDQLQHQPDQNQNQSFTDKHRVAARHYYVKTHAPAIFVALLAGYGVGDDAAKLRAQAIEQAGLLFDELEPK